MTPNPENGEFCIPSDVYHEINESSSSCSSSSTFLFHAPLFPFIFPLPIPFLHPYVTGYFPGYGFYLCCPWIAAFQLLYNPFPFYFPIIPPYQVLKSIQGPVYPTKCRGTGVFIPHIVMNSSNKKSKLQGKSEIIVPFKHQLIVNNEKSKSKKYICFEKKEGSTKEEESQLSQELNLPQEWTYS